MTKPSYAKSEKFIGRGLDAFGLKKQLLEELRRKRSSVKEVRLLEIGCGQGNLLFDLLERFPHLKTSGINKSATHGARNQREMTIRAKEQGFAIAPCLYIGDAIRLPFGSEVFDVVVS